MTGTARDPGGADVFDVAAALAYTGGDEELLRELLGVFLAEVPGQARTLLAAVGRREARAVREAAHGLKGPLRALGAGRSAALAQELENRGASGQVGEAGPLAEALLAEIDTLLAAVRSWLAGPAAPRPPS